MKKLILIAVVGLMACHHIEVSSTDNIITKEVKHSGCLCDFYIYGADDTSFGIYFTDTCSKWDVGDTINFVTDNVNPHSHTIK